MAKFLSEEWAAEVTSIMNAHEGFMNALGAAVLAIQFQVGEDEDSAVNYYLSTTGGAASIALGNVENADVTVRQSYETACAISKGELDTQTAFMTGRLKVSGNLAKLMMHQSLIRQWADAVSGMDVEY